MPLRVEEEIHGMRCPECSGNLLPKYAATEMAGFIKCASCAEEFPIINGIPRMLLSPIRDALRGKASNSNLDSKQLATANSFGFEWSRFPQMYPEWEQNFLDYMAPHEPEFFRDKRVLDAGCGSGRHAYYAAQFGADVWAIDIGPAVEVARGNTLDSGRVHVIQADLNNLPFPTESFDFIYSIGVLHHLPEPEAAFRNLLCYLKPGGEIQIYLYWEPEGQPLKRMLLGVVRAVRQITMRLPHRIIYALSYPAACGAFLFFVWPYKLMRRFPGIRKLAEMIPMKQYTRYPFRVCVNDQFDRFSAPIENRYTREEAESWLARAGLEETSVQPNCGWSAIGRKPAFVASEVAAVSSAAHKQD